MMDILDARLKGLRVKIPLRTDDGLATISITEDEVGTTESMGRAVPERA